MRITLFILAMSMSIISRSQLRDNIQIENLVFKGAGIRGIAYCGALQELKELGLTAGLRRVAGTSSGAITACLLALGYTPQEIFTLISSTRFQKFNDGGYIFIGGSFRVIKNFGWYRGHTFPQWLEKLIDAKTRNRNITFHQLYELAQLENQFLELTVATTSLNHQQTVFLSNQTYPHMRIADAVRASMAIPLYFEPVIINEDGKKIGRKEMKPTDHILVDGGLTAIFPLQVFDSISGEENGAMKTLGLHVESAAQTANDFENGKMASFPIANVRDYVGAMYTIIKENMYRQTFTETDFSRSIAISDSGIGPRVKRMSEKQKEALMESGRTSVRMFFLKMSEPQ
ncbi:MAG: patatin-like phospholipase family protein [Flavobacteriales bacterium]|nr:patatin-like phospholipase family protein [Flavobacteriales bacterium]